MADKQTVKVGDKVRCLVTEFDVRKGELYEVLEVQDSGRVWFLDDVSDRFYLEVDEYELLPVAEATGKPAFKVGDRVHGTYGHVSGAGTIEDCDESHMPYLVKFDTYPWALWCYREDVIALALTIETGKFYRTRDGRKVGPMDEWISDQFRERAGDGRYWTVDGVGHNEAKGEDLIAEWVDEPAGNDNAPATTPAIVALIEDGHPKPSGKPKVHKSEESATDEAERLAVKYPGQKFGVFVLADSRIADVVIRRAA
ncbi:hypothetical protein [Brucella anthropi]|uniref:hypothetical protein n=1 Tax=Brucella anthropi TaxID=529 RepID=UPI0005C2D984|nr:hypothetical protein [Brucella anthropi]KIU66138.1 hypothetical protein TR92_20315 [Brucella anthropi]